MVMYRAYFKSDQQALFRRERTIVVQGMDRSWFAADVLRSTHVHYLQTTHDDCWLHPDRYLDYVC